MKERLERVWREFGERGLRVEKRGLKESIESIEREY